MVAPMYEIELSKAEIEEKILQYFEKEMAVVKKKDLERHMEGLIIEAHGKYYNPNGEHRYKLKSQERLCMYDKCGMMVKDQHMTANIHNNTTYCRSCQKTIKRII